MAIDEYMKMPEETHGTGEKAVNQVAGVFIDHRCAVDSIKADYGEDLLIQPSFDGQVEHFKIWVQVKGTADIEKYRQASGEIVRYVDFAHMFKWLRSKELCILVFWNVDKKKGLFYLPKMELSEWDFYTQRKPSIRVVFNEENVFSEETLPQLIWRARYEHYAMLVSHAIGRESFSVSEESKRHARSMYLSVLIDFLRQVDLIIREPLAAEEEVDEEDVLEAGYKLRFCDKFRTRVVNACAELQKKYPEDDLTTIAQMALGLSLLVTLEERTGAFGVPPELLEPCIPAIAGMMALI
ncbi:DUF4365 domain-containing protein [Burkholderia metallica]|uniref:DUF4365 domain-containing protein n=1 Tax=Burkholderia metallica TaxID=488729 RepID=UPI000D1BE701|nr:DUF4365 domain-containing protein [Burkholderia metallica]